MPRDDDSILAGEFPDALRKIRERTPARILAGRAGAAYRTATQLELREAHAAARDAVRAELDLDAAFGPEFIQQWKLFEVSSVADSKEDFLLHPEKGRHFGDPSRQTLLARCSRENDVQIAIGDGLSVTALAAQIPGLLPLLDAGAEERDWSRGSPFVIRHCRVGILNEIGELLAPSVAILLIGERPGLATAESLSAYMAYQPGSTHTDANRNLVSNIHARGLRAERAAERILNIAAQMMTQHNSGFRLRDEFGHGREGPGTLR
jgi:ethanolamine ammonia-lyase small subunit